MLLRPPDISPGLVFVALFAAVAAFVVLVVVRVRRRRAFAPAQADAPLPNLATQQRASATIRRTFRDPAQGVWLVDVVVGPKRLTFCATDYAANAARYTGLVGQTVEVALYALATLAPGGVEAIRDQIKDIDKVEAKPDLVALVREGQHANDYVVIGRVLDARPDAWDEMALTVYRTQVIRSDQMTFVLDLAAPQAASGDGFAPRSLVHGSARLFGYLA